MCGMQHAAFAAITMQSKENWGRPGQHPDFSTVEAACSWSPEAHHWRGTWLSAGENERNYVFRASFPARKKSCG